jgi:hypothetical protein
MARLAVIEYSIDWRMCHSAWGLIGSHRFESPIALVVMNGIAIGSGLPMVSVRMPIMLWKCAVVRSPPLNHVEYGAPRRCVTPGFPSVRKRSSIIAPTTSMPAIA